MNFGIRRKISVRRRETRRWRDPLEKALRPENIQLRDSSLNQEKTNDIIRKKSVRKRKKIWFDVSSQKNKHRSATIFLFRIQSEFSSHTRSFVTTDNMCHPFDTTFVIISDEEETQALIEVESKFFAITYLGRAIEECGIENEIATFLKKRFDEKYGGVWQCIVGRNFGMHLDCNEFIHMYISKISILLFKC